MDYSQLIIKDGVKEYQGQFWDEDNQQWVSKKFYVTLTQKNEILYTACDGKILRIIQFNQISQNEIMTNLEHIINLQWLGKYGKNQQKVGRWVAKWKNEIIKDVGGWYNQYN